VFLWIECASSTEPGATPQPKQGSLIPDDTDGGTRQRIISNQMSATELSAAARVYWDDHKQSVKRSEWRASSEALLQMFRTDPKNVRLAEFCAREIAESIPPEVVAPAAQYAQLRSSIELLLEAIRRNPNQASLFWLVGSYCGHRLGDGGVYADDFADLFPHDGDFHQQLHEQVPIEPGGSGVDGKVHPLLVASLWFEKAEAVMASGDDIGNRRQFMVYSQSPLMWARYAEDIEEKGYRDVGAEMWRRSESRWNKLAKREFDTDESLIIKGWLRRCRFERDPRVVKSRKLFFQARRRYLQSSTRDDADKAASRTEFDQAFEQLSRALGEHTRMLNDQTFRESLANPILFYKVRLLDGAALPEDFALADLVTAAESDRWLAVGTAPWVSPPSGILRKRFGGTFGARHVSLSSDESKLFCGMSDASIWVIKSSTWGEPQIMKDVGNILSTGKGPNGQAAVVTESGGKLTVRYIDTGEVLCTHRESRGQSQVLLTPDGKRLLIHFGSLRFISRAIGQLTDKVEFSAGDVLREAPDRSTFLQFTNDGDRLLVGSTGGTIYQFDWKVGKMLSALVPSEAMAYAANAETTEVAVSSRDTLKIWSLPRSMQIASWKPRQGQVITALAFLDDGSLASGDTRGRVDLWVAGEERPRKSYEVHTRALFTLA
jgi:hypothetical protein